jgi:alpha-glucosidase
MGSASIFSMRCIKDAGFLDNPPSLRPLPSEDNADGFFQQQPATPSTIPTAWRLPGQLRAQCRSTMCPVTRDFLSEKCSARRALSAFLLRRAWATDSTWSFCSRRCEPSFLPQAFHSLISMNTNESLPSPLLPTWVLGNHDRARYIERVGNDPRRAKVLATLQLTARGVPFLYQGEEIGTDEPRSSDCLGAGSAGSLPIGLYRRGYRR